MSTTEDCRDEARFLGYDCELAVPATAAGRMHSALANLVRAVHAEIRAHPALVAEQFAELATAHVPGVADAGVLLVSHKRPVGLATSSDSDSRLIDWITEHTHDGPCLEAATHARIVRVPDIANDDRWP